LWTIAADNRQLLIKLLAIFDFELKEATTAGYMEAWSSLSRATWICGCPVMDGYGNVRKRIKATVKGSATIIA